MKLDLKSMSTLELLKRVKKEAMTTAAHTEFLNELIEREVNNKIIHPIGWAVGREDEVFQVFWNISIEMMGHRSDLREEIIRGADNVITSLANTYVAELLEKYAVAVMIAALQIMTPDQRSHCHISGLEELAEKYNLFLPEFKTEETNAS